MTAGDPHRGRFAPDRSSRPIIGGTAPAAAGPADAGPAAAGPADAGPADAEPPGAGPADSGPADAGAAGALRAAAALGPYFAVEVAAPGPGWRPVADLAADPAVLAERIDTAHALLVERTGLDPQVVERRVVASVWFLGLAARLVCPAFGAAALTGVVPDLPLHRLTWLAAPAGPIPLRVAAPTGRRAVDPVAAADALHALVVDRLGPLVTAVRGATRLAPPLLWGNVAAALGGAVRTVGDAAPARAAPAAAVAALLLRRPPLAGTGRLVRPDRSRPSWFLVRRNCCLYYRLPGGGTCADCVLVPAEVRARQWAAALDRGDQPDND